MARRAGAFRAKGPHPVSLDEHAEALGPALLGALTEHGFSELTAVQLAVLQVDVAGNDLRISSQTGSGKTVALGLVIRALVGPAAADGPSVAAPHAVVIVPTRELAKQVEEELAWLFAPLSARVVGVTGGSNPRDERRNLSRGTSVVVGTPGRLLDHLERGSIDPRQVGAVVLDEADRMLDMGFREDIEAILAKMPNDRATHLVSATFPREVEALARKVQLREPIRIEGTKHGEANADIDHVVALVDPEERFDAIVNLLLLDPTERTLVFARTRADVASLAELLDEAGFSARPISGDLEQPERLRVLRAFKRGDLRILVATDVAARGLDVQGITRVIHADPPLDPDSYTHRSGRTGRAGKKGASVVVAIPAELGLVNRVLRRAGITFRVEPAPTPDAIRKSADARLLEDLTGESAEAPPEGAIAFARKLIAASSAELAIARLLVRVEGADMPAPRDVRVIEPPPMRPEPRGRADRWSRDGGRDRDRGPRRFDRDAPRFERDAPRVDREPPRFDRDAPRPAPQAANGDAPRVAPPVIPPPTPSAPGETFASRIADSQRARPERARHGADAPRPVWGDRPAPSDRAPRDDRAPRNDRGPREERGRGPRDDFGPRPDRGEKTSQPTLGVFVPFQVTWGSAHGADPRRLLALVCRRGGIRGSDVGAIHVGESTSVVEVAESVGDQFATSASQPDPRDPRVRIRRDDGAAPPPRERLVGSRDPRDRETRARPPVRDREPAARPAPRREAPPEVKPPVRPAKVARRIVSEAATANERPVRRRTPR
jgi:ATP-dependent RNA helicase DeaD